MTGNIPNALPAISVNNLTVYYDNTLALENICLNVREGEFLGIIGPNGGGKSTLLKAILNLVRPSSGEVLIYGKPPSESHGIIGYVPQHTLLDRKFPISVFEVVLSGFTSTKITPFYRYSKEDIKKAEEMLELLDITPLSQRQISSLSGGQFQRMLIARALASNPRLLLLDEPTASVDAKTREHIYELLAKLNKEMTIILVSHDLLAISTRVNRIACLNESLVYHGEPELTGEVVNKLYGCPVELIAHGVPHRVLKEHNGEGHIC